jgi:hypothetical protein
VVNVNNVHVTNIHNYGGIHPLHNGMRFSNQANLHNVHVGRAMSTVNAGRFGAGRVSAVAARPEQLRGARMMAGNLPIVPSRASLSASGRPASSATIRNGGAQRFFGAHNNMARPASFQQQTASLRQTMQQNRVGAIPAGGRSNGGFAGRGPSAAGTMQRPSAGIANRQAGSFGNGNAPSRNAQSGANRPFGGNNSASRPEPQRGTSQAAPAENRGGFRPFTPPSGNNRPVGGNSSVTRPEPQRGTSQASPAENRGGFRPFNPPSRSEAAHGGTSGSAAIQMGTGEDHHGRSWICVSRSCAVLPTAEAGTREVDTHRAMVDLAAHRAILAQVTAAVARGQHLAMAAVGMRLAAAVAVGMHQAVEAVAIPAVAVTPEVEDTPATTKSVCCKLK